ncbi:MAG: LCP family protein [Chloroflexota bacterium]
MTSRRRIRASAIVVALVAAVTASGVTGYPTASAASGIGDPGGPGIDWLRLGMDLAAPARPLLAAMEGAEAINYGSDGRLTFLLLGSDARGTGIARTDSIMVVSLKGKSISAASIPRDTARIPIPASMGGGTFSGKVNGILRTLRNSSSSLDDALNKFERVIENLLRIEIDYRALVWFNGFTTLVGKVDPVTLNIGREVIDAKHADDPNASHGVYFPKWNGYALSALNPSGRPLCNGDYKADLPPPVASKYWCRRALPFVRSRKGPGNNDWVRSRRQQEFIAATIKAVAQYELSGLVSTAQSEGAGKWWTNYPISMTSATDLYNALSGATLKNSVVFKPRTYANRISGTSGYELKLSAVRQWTATYMK